MDGIINNLATSICRDNKYFGQEYVTFSTKEKEGWRKDQSTHTALISLTSKSINIMKMLNAG